MSFDESNAGVNANATELVWVTFSCLDKLPARLRQIIAYAPYDYQVEPYLVEWRTARDELSEDEIAARWVSEMADHRRLEARDLYGPNHPQATA